jgi:hypothetical protein
MMTMLVATLGLGALLPAAMSHEIGSDSQAAARHCHCGRFDWGPDSERIPAPDILCLVGPPDRPLARGSGGGELRLTGKSSEFSPSDGSHYTRSPKLLLRAEPRDHSERCVILFGFEPGELTGVEVRVVGEIAMPFLAQPNPYATLCSNVRVVSFKACVTGESALI